MVSKGSGNAERVFYDQHICLRLPAEKFCGKTEVFLFSALLVLRGEIIMNTLVIVLIAAVCLFC